MQTIQIVTGKITIVNRFNRICNFQIKKFSKKHFKAIIMMKTLTKKCLKKKRKYKKCVNNQARLEVSILQQWGLLGVAEQIEMIVAWILEHLEVIVMITSQTKQRTGKLLTNNKQAFLNKLRNLELMLQCMQNMLINKFNHVKVETLLLVILLAQLSVLMSLHQILKVKNSLHVQNNTNNDKVNFLMHKLVIQDYQDLM